MNKTARKISLARLQAICAGFVIALGIWLPAVSWAASGGVSQGFKTDETDLASGTLMQVKPGNSDIVEQATSSGTNHLVGVVADKSLIELSDGNREVQITISGVSKALVSDINGDIQVGDKITASPIQGVGMKATDPGQVVGTAQGNLDNTTTTEKTITDKEGKSQTVKLGVVPLQVNVGYFSGQEGQGKLASLLPPSILAFANNVAGQQVSPLRIIISLFALVFGFIIVANMLQAGIRANIISMGRNPLAKRALRRELIDVCLTGLGILLLTLVLIYLILKL